MMFPTDLSVANILKKVISLAVKIKPVPTNSSVANNLEKARSITNTLMICVPYHVSVCMLSFNIQKFAIAKITDF
jgi:hypothetical protein